ncbi:DUF6207 family protein [Streptomyces sp. Act-28]
MSTPLCRLCPLGTRSAQLSRSSPPGEADGGIEGHWRDSTALDESITEAHVAEAEPVAANVTAADGKTAFVFQEALTSRWAITTRPGTDSSAGPCACCALRLRRGAGISAPRRSRRQAVHHQVAAPRTLRPPGPTLAGESAKVVAGGPAGRRPGLRGNAAGGGCRRARTIVALTFGLPLRRWSGQGQARRVAFSPPSGNSSGRPLPGTVTWTSTGRD